MNLYLQVLQDIYDKDGKAEKYIADFLNYWLIQLTNPGRYNKVIDIPVCMVPNLSKTFGTSNLTPFKTFSSPTHTFYRHIFNTVGVNLANLCKFAKPKFKQFIEDLLKNDIKDFPTDTYKDPDGDLPGIIHIIEMDVKN